MPVRAILVLALSAALFAGCGRRGALEAPGEPGAEAVSDAAPRPGAVPLTADDASAGATEPAEAAPGATAPEPRFILDPLI